MGTIVVIGGGKIGEFETLLFDKRIVELSSKKNPKVLFIPTASSDRQEYVTMFKNTYEKKLSCEVSVLRLVSQTPSYEEIKKTILDADVIYVGGGNTLMMVTLWKKLGVDLLLKQAYEKGTILSGISAGGICWFEQGHSDSMSFSSPKNWKYIKVDGLGLLRGIHCPHFNSGTTRNGKRKLRKHDFLEMMKGHDGFGIAIDNNCAIEFIDGSYRVMQSKDERFSYRTYRKQGEVILEKLPLEVKGTIATLYENK